MLNDLFSIRNLFIAFFSLMAVAALTCIANIECLVWLGNDPINDFSLRVEATVIPLAIVCLVGVVIRMALD